MLDKAEWPEVKREDVKIAFSDGVIIISSERKCEKKKVQEANKIRIASFYGTFSRSFSPDSVDPKSIRGDQRRSRANDPTEPTPMSRRYSSCIAESLCRESIGSL